MIRRARLICPSLCAFCLSLALSFQAIGQSNYNYRHELVNTPVYDPASKSYFEMVDGAHGMVMTHGVVEGEGPTWAQADNLSKQRSYKGARGRLAIVKDLATQEFLMRTFNPSTRVWIGVRYWCATRRLQDSTGRFLDRSDFMAWAKDWQAGGFICANDPATHMPLASDYMPVAYSAVSEGFQWIGLGAGKRFYYFFVEYPTGGP